MEPMRMRLMTEKIDKAACSMRGEIYTQIAPLAAECAVTREPVRYEDRLKLEYSAVKTGDVWSSRVFDCAWFHISGTAEEGEDLYLGIDIDGEGCLYGADGVPLRGITNVSSDFDRTLGFPGKRYVPLSDFGRSGVVDVWMDAGNNDLFGNFRGGKINMLGVYRCNAALRKLYYDYKFLQGVAEGLDARNPLKMGILYALERVAVSIGSRPGASKIAAAREVLQPYLQRKGALEPSLTFYAVGHSHLDLAWLWPIRETRRKAARTFSTALANLAAYPDYVYGASQPQQFAWVKQDYPQLYERLRAAVASGRIELQGGMWVESDTNLPSGESLIRQFYYGKKFWKDEFGRQVDTLWLPDVFGFSAALPQIMRGCGCENLLTIKLSWSMVNKFPYHSFRWRGIDGSEVLVHMPPEGTYNSSATPQAVFAAAGEYAERGISQNAMMLYGIGDGGGGPGREHLEYVSRSADVCGMPRVKNAGADEFFAALNRERELLPVYRGEMYLERHQGTYTSQSENKRFNRLTENAFVQAEFACALFGRNYSAELDELWKETLLYQFHDIIPGSSIARVYDETAPRYREILARLEAVTQAAASGGELCAINATSYNRSEYIMHGGEWYKADALPYSVAKLKKAGGEGSCKASGLTVQNSEVLAEFDADGTLAQLIVMRSGKQRMSRGNVLNVYDDDFDAWDTYAGYADSIPERFTLVKATAFNERFRAGIVFEYGYGESVMTQTVCVCEGSPLLRFETAVDWRETKKMLRADFYPQAYTDVVTCDIQFGNISRSMNENNSHEWAQFEICAHKWVDVSAEDGGVALLNDCKYGYRAKNGLLSINLLRSQMYPCADQDKGSHFFTYALMPHDGSVGESGVAAYAYALNRPLKALKSTPCESLVRCDNIHAVIETVKPAYDGRGTVARIYNDSASHITAKIACKGETSICDMLEQNDVACDKTLDFAPFEIKTVRIVSDK